MPLSIHDLGVVRRAGWELVRLRSPELEVEVLPGKGGDIVTVRSRARDVNVLWSTPWGLRDLDDEPTSEDSQERFLHRYPGGWQTLFPNGGTAAEGQPFHGEACMVAWQWSPHEVDDGVAIVLTTALQRSAFRLQRIVHLTRSTVTVTEEITSTGPLVQQAMWSHHPAFGVPFLDAGCRLDTAAAAFVADPDYVTDNGDLAPGARSGWPLVAGRDGDPRDLSVVPREHAGVDRFGYLLDLPEPRYVLTNPALEMAVTVHWDGRAFPHAWYWLEARGTQGPPWSGQAYVLAIEPASSWPGAGLPAARAAGTAVDFAPGQTRSAWVSMQVSG